MLTPISGNNRIFVRIAVCCISIFYIIGINVPAYCQAKNDSILVWNKHKKLSVADFKHQNDSFAAHIGYGYRMSTFLDISIDVSEYKRGDSVYTYNIYPVFFRYQSWLDDTAKLEHEQLHFDISEVYARRMRRWLVLMRGTPRGYRYANEKLTELYKEHEAYQARYDRETNSGRFPNMQILWNKHIAIQLDTLKQYEQPKGRTKL